MDIALWGYGYHGHDLEAIIEHSWSSEYRITAVFDRQYERIRGEKLAYDLVDDPSKIPEWYRKGLFDAVLVGIFDSKEKMRAEEFLNAHDVPVLTLKANLQFFDPRSFPQIESDLALDRNGYELFVYDNMYLSSSPHGLLRFITDADGRNNRAYWYNYQIRQNDLVRICKPVIKQSAQELAGDWCCLTFMYADNYWHFTYDVLHRIWLMERCGFQGRYLLMHSGFVEELLSLMDVDTDRVTWFQDLDWSETYHFEKLYCPAIKRDDRAITGEVLREAAAVITENLPPLAHDYPERIYVKRVGKRKLHMQDELLDKYGFVTIVPEELSVAEQIRFFQQADIVISPHGANTTNSLYMKPGSVLIETFPANYVNPCCLETLAMQNVAYLQLTQTMEPSKGIIQRDADYEINPVMMEMAIENALRLQGGTRLRDATKR